MREIFMMKWQNICKPDFESIDGGGINVKEKNSADVDSEFFSCRI